jgi:hypothetical protein
MTDPEYDAEFEAFLKRRSPLHRRLSDIDNAEPSVEIDRLVLNRAREAIDTPSPPLFKTSRWALPLGLAATILIAFTVVLNIDHHAATTRSAASTASPPAARAAPVSDSSRLDQPSVLSDSAVHNGRAAQKKTAAPTAVAKRYDIPEAPDAANASASSARLTASSSAVASRSIAAPVATPPAAPKTPSDDPHSTPEAWLREINRLRAAGKTAEADRELVAFREAYPTHPAYSVARPPAR